LEIEIDVGHFCNEKYELETTPSPERAQFVALQIYRSSCLKNAIMIDNYYDPTDQLDFIMVGFICPAEMKHELYKLIKELISTAHTINKYCNPKSWYENLDHAMTGKATASPYFPVNKVAHKNSYKILPEKDLPQKTTFKIDAKGKHSPFALEKRVIFHD